MGFVQPDFPPTSNWNAPSSIAAMEAAKTAEKKKLVKVEEAAMDDRNLSFKLWEENEKVMVVLI